MRFRAVIELSGKTAAGIRVPPGVVAALGTSRKPAVRATINGFTYRTSVAVMGGTFMLGIPPEFRTGAGVAPGDEVEIDLELDTAPREVAIPSELAAALRADPVAQRTFDALSYSNKRRLVEPIAAIKGAESRERRIAKTVAMLHEGRS